MAPPPPSVAEVAHTVSDITSTIAQKLGFTESTSTRKVITQVAEDVTHALDSLREYEIKKASDVVRANYPAGTALYFKSICLDEPPKAEMIPYLEAEHAGKPLPIIARIVRLSFYTVQDRVFHEATVDMALLKVLSNEIVPKEFVPSADGEEMFALETCCLEDEGVKEEIRKLKLPAGATVCCDPWIYGTDDEKEDRRLWQCYMYLRDPKSNHIESNHYAMPLDFSPIIDDKTRKVIRIMRLPLGEGFETTEEGGDKEPWVDRQGNEYFHDFVEHPRTDLKPYQVVQPEGPSFSVKSELIEWQKWRFRIAFNYREGLTLHDVHYDGRSTFYRLSLSDMFVPYGDPRSPYHRKSAFDFGDVGCGICCNNLQLGCDCLGTIHYFSGYVTDSSGNAKKVPNAICLHEEDAGIGWKHTNYRTGTAAVTRSRVLVLQTIITVANYEYCFAWKFGQAGDIHFETRATGILSTAPINDGVNSPWGTTVSPGVLATNHQHLFSLRIDPAIDGYKNTLVYEDSIRDPVDPKLNPHGVGYRVKTTTMEKAGYADLDLSVGRVFKIQNSCVHNPINGKPVAYKLHTQASQMLLADPSSFHARRAEFADHPIWVVKYKDGELYSGSKYTNQSKGGHGIKSWVARGDATVDEDIVVYHTFGLTHNPRVEDFPVMPCEIMNVSLKPNNFFDKNPALDVPRSEQHFNRSVSAANGHHQSTQECSACP